MLWLGFYNNFGEWLPYKTERRNFSIFGQSQTGKTTFLATQALLDIHDGRNVTVIGDDLTEEVLRYIPRDRVEDVVYFNPSLQPFGFNPLYRVPKEQHYARADAIVNTVHTLLTYDGSTPAMDDYIRITALTLLSISPISNNLLSLYYFLTDDDYRQERLRGLHDPLLRKYWKRFDSGSNKEKRDEVKSTLNKLSKYVFHPKLRDCLIQRANHLDFRNKIVLVSLDRFALGTAGASLIGALVIATMQSDPDIETTLFVDNADNYGGQVFIDLLIHPGITTLLSARSPFDFRDHLNSILKSSDVLCYRVTEHDAEPLKNVFKLGPQAVQLYGNRDFRAYVLHNLTPRQLQFTPHSFERPPRTRRRGHKRVEQSIIDYNWRWYTEPKSKIETLLRELL